MYDSYTSNILEVKGMSAKIHSIVDEQMALGVKPENIIIGGFSQGGALALYASLTCPVRIGGTFILSSWMVAPWEFSGMVKPSVVHALPNCQSPMLQCHGLADLKVIFVSRYFELEFEVTFQVPSLWAAHCAGILSNIHNNYRVKQYKDLGHEVNDAVQLDLALFISNIISK